MCEVERLLVWWPVAGSAVVSSVRSVRCVGVSPCSAKIGELGGRDLVRTVTLHAYMSSVGMTLETSMSYIA